MKHHSYSLGRGYSLVLSEKPGNAWKNSPVVFASAEYLNALEEAELKGFSYLYGEIYKQSSLAGLLYFQLIDLSFIKIGSVIHSEPYGRFMKLISDKIRHSLLGRTRSRKHYMLVHGNMCVSGNYGSFIHPDHLSAFPSLYNKIYKSVVTHAEPSGDVSVSIVKDFPFDGDLLQQELKGEGFIRFVMDPVMKLKLDPDWKTMEDYLSSLSSKYRLRASNAIEKVDGFALRELDLFELEIFREELEVLYQSVISKSPVRIVQPDMNYIISLKKNVSDFKIHAWFEGKKPVAFFTYFHSGRISEAHHIGIDYHLNKTHALYQNILYALIRKAIEYRSEELDYGRTAMEMKSTVGAVPHDFAAYIKMSSRVMNHLVKPFLPSEPPKNWVQRDPFRTNAG